MEDKNTWGMANGVIFNVSDMHVSVFYSITHTALWPVGYSKTKVPRALSFY